MKTILIILGTRPEAIKLAPVILELKKHSKLYNVVICNTEQQKELSNQTLSFFDLRADYNLNVMQPNQTLDGVQSILLNKLSEIYQKHKINATIVQGDTMTAFCGGLVSFYNKVPVYHVEAGLRSYDMLEPFPEEAMRQMLGRITSMHFAPTKDSERALLKENIAQEKILVTGNTVIDALYCLSKDVLNNAQQMLRQKNIIVDDKFVLVTVHRRENHGERLDNILNSIYFLAKSYPTHKFILPVHPNPNVKDKIYIKLDELKNVILTSPLDYPELVCLMQNAKLILTDSGGIQEEAPTFGCPVLVMRFETERKEGVVAGFAKLVGADEHLIISEAKNILDKNRDETRFDGTKNPYGDGKASGRIRERLDLHINTTMSNY